MGETLRYCTQPGCPTLVPRGRCAVHTKAQRQATDRYHADAAVSYTSQRWIRAARAFRTAHPFCVYAADAAVDCDIVTEQVDHIVPHRGDVGRFWDAANWQPMCRRCHARKTARETLPGQRPAT